MTQQSFDLRQLLELAPPNLQPYLVVAGGYVASPSQACDIDLWLLDPYQNRDVIRDQLRVVTAHLSEQSGWSVFERQQTSSEDLPEEYTLGNLGGKGYTYVGRFQKEGWPLPVQFFIAPYQRVEELLADFDISTHQWAIAPATGELWKAPTATDNTEVRVTNWDTPSTTLARLEKLCRRYGFSLDSHPDVAKLIALVEAQLNTAA